MPSFDVAIHGAGLVGQSLALHLAKAGFKVALVSSASQADNADYHEDVRAFALGHAAKAWLTPLGAWSEDADTTPVTAMQIVGDAGGQLDFHDTAALNWIVEVPALAARLNQLVANEPGITHLNPSAKQMPVQTKLDVICDKKCELWQSAAYSQSQPRSHTTPYGQHAIAARLTSQRAHEQKALQWFNDAGEVLALLPTGGVDGASYALVWSLDSARAHRLAKANPADFLNELNQVSQLCAKPTQSPEQPRPALELTLDSQRALWPLVLSKTQTWCGAAPKPWVLAGDAAHTVHPLAGQGLNLGFGDAAALAKQLIDLQNARGAGTTSTQLARCLRAYTRERKAAAARIASLTDGLHLLYGRKNALIQGLRNTGLNTVNNLSFAKRWLIQQAQS